MLGVAAASLAGFMRWRSTSYTVDEHGVHWQSGIVRKKQTTVPLDRIQGLDTVAGPVQRLFGVVAVHVQTRGRRRQGRGRARRGRPGGGRAAARGVRARQPDAVEDAAGRDLPERRLSRRDGLLAALTAGQLGVILPVARGRLPALHATSSRTSSGVEEASRLAPDTLGGWELASAP